MKLLFLADVSGRVAHVGDEAMLEANIALFRRLLPSCSIEVAAGPGWDGSRLGVHAVSRLEFPRDSEAARVAMLEMPDAAHPAVRAALGCDALIISGGGNLCSSWPHHIYERLAMARIAASRGVPVIVLGQTLGPALQPRERTLVAELLQLAAWIGVRETHSHTLALELGTDVAKLSHQLDDAAFLTPVRVPADELEKMGLAGSDPWIAVTAHPFGELTVRNPVVAEFASSLRAIAHATGAALVFVPHVRFEEPGATPDDAEFGTMIARALYCNPPMRIAPVLPSPQALWLTQRASLVISTRYHPLVFASAGGVPALGIWNDEYTRVKLEGALAHAERPEDAMPIGKMLAGSLAAKAINLWHSRAMMKEQLEERAQIWRANEEARATKLRDLLQQLPARAGKAGI